jgi:dipeptidyl aminopeptidase/acylaminoacyl peptidase
LRHTEHIILNLVFLAGLFLVISSSASAEERPVRLEPQEAVLDEVPVQLTESKEAFICPAFSPDGSRIAVTRSDWQGLWLIGADGSGLRRLTDDPGAGYRFAWSPDGSQIAYRAEQQIDGLRHFAIRIVNAETGHTEELTEFQRYLSTPRWVLGDGTVAYETDRDGTLAQALVIGLIEPQPKDASPHRVATTSRDLRIWISEADGFERWPVSSPGERCFDPQISPGEDRVCYTVLDGGGRIAVAELDGTHRIDLGYGSNPSWSPDGQYLVFEVTEDDGHVITGSDLYIAAVDGAGRIRLTDTPALFERWPAWSPDDRRIVYSAAVAIYTIPVPVNLHQTEEEAP